MKPLLALLILIGFIHSALATPSAVNFENETIAANLKWQSTIDRTFPASTSIAFINWRRDHIAENTSFAWFDIDHDGKPEIVVTDSDFPSGGRAFLFMRFIDGKWQNIADFRGGFVLLRANRKQSYRIQLLERDPNELYFTELVFRNGKYVAIFKTKLAGALYDEALHRKWQMLNSLSIESQQRFSAETN